MPGDINAGAEFQALPLEYMITTPLVATVKAQAAAADATAAYLERLIDQKSRRPKVVKLAVDYKGEKGGGPATATFNAPLLSLVPVPHLRIDALDIDFNYSVSQTVGDTRSFEWGVEAEANGGASWGVAHVEATVKGHVQSKSALESQVNRSGALAIKVHASESPMPEGLARVLTLLANSVGSSSEQGGDGLKKVG